MARVRDGEAAGEGYWPSVPRKPRMDCSWLACAQGRGPAGDRQLASATERKGRGGRAYVGGLGGCSGRWAVVDLDVRCEGEAAASATVGRGRDEREQEATDHSARPSRPRSGRRAAGPLSRPRPAPRSACCGRATAGGGGGGAAGRPTSTSGRRVRGGRWSGLRGASGLLLERDMVREGVSRGDRQAWSGRVAGDGRRTVPFERALRLDLARLRDGERLNHAVVPAQARDVRRLALILPPSER